VVTSFADSDKKDRLAVFPNPAKDKVTITNFSIENISRLKVYNGLSVMVYDINEPRTKTIFTKGWKSGLYKIELELKSGEVHYFSFIKE
jgi:hypothetical protein